MTSARDKYDAAIVAAAERWFVRWTLGGGRVERRWCASLDEALSVAAAQGRPAVVYAVRGREGCPVQVYLPDKSGTARL